jgi:hypothetical protein
MVCRGLNALAFGVIVMDTQVAREGSETYTKEGTTTTAPPRLKGK